ncbi:hypothetical protein [Streptomyces roseicoloratus]|uniref:Lipoprotein n=1 Tax=Streptomyces roseicoloratus TaxID=2508722 RepID=A0ABY9RWJ0_9ACTN|nr:hypothetical protein [Streptomyces roseicoloratus]WMX46536.1 hypothetical protein RGF97_19160 [Streptomyces roseicoloratus]
MTTSRKTTRPAAFAALTLLSLLATATATACSGGGGEAPPGAGGGEEGKKADQAFEHRKCLREHGLDVPEPKPGEQGVGLTVGGDGVGKEKIEAAFKACQDKAGGAGWGKEPTQADKDKALAYARCMRENGYDMPDPNFDGGMQKALPMPQGAGKQTFEKAMKKCEGVAR